jgi:hypothetical protein
MWLLSQLFFPQIRLRTPTEWGYREEGRSASGAVAIICVISIICAI